MQNRATCEFKYIYIYVYVYNKNKGAARMLRLIRAAKRAAGAATEQAASYGPMLPGGTRGEVAKPDLRPRFIMLVRVSVLLKVRR